MTTVPRWGVLSALLAPLLLVGGWSVAAALRPDAYDPMRRTISDLAAARAPHRWVMTFALLGVGLCHLVTAAALRPVAVPGRAVLALGGVATLLVAANPLQAAGSSGAHTAAASVAFGALACWPLLAWRRDEGPAGSWARHRASPQPRCCSARWRGSSCNSAPGRAGWPSGAPPRCRRCGRWSWCCCSGTSPRRAGGPEPARRRPQATSAAAARPAARPENRQPPRKVPSSER